MNNKGFTLIELLATIIILALILAIGTYSITAIINKSKKENYDLMLKHIKDASEVYYQECKYANNSGIDCSEDGNVTLGNLVTYGYLKGNSKGNDDKYTLVNPINNENIASCIINVAFTDGKVKVKAITTNNNCPTEY